MTNYGDLPTDIVSNWLLLKKAIFIRALKYLVFETIDFYFVPYIYYSPHKTTFVSFQLKFEPLE